METPFYIRTRQGDTYFVKSLDEAISELAGEDGYRLTLEASDGTQIIIRRAGEGDPSPYIPGETEYGATVVVRVPNKTELRSV